MRNVADRTVPTECMMVAVVRASATSNAYDGGKTWDSGTILVVESAACEITAVAKGFGSRKGGVVDRTAATRSTDRFVSGNSGERSRFRASSLEKASCRNARR